MMSELTSQQDYIRFLQGLAFLLCWILSRSSGEKSPGKLWSRFGWFCLIQMFSSAVDLVTIVSGRAVPLMACIMMQLLALLSLGFCCRSVRRENALSTFAIIASSTLYSFAEVAAYAHIWMNLPALILSGGILVLVWEYYLTVGRQGDRSPQHLYRWMQGALIVVLAAGWLAAHAVSRYMDALNDIPRKSHFEMANQLLENLVSSSSRTLKAFSPGAALLARVSIPPERDSQAGADQILDEMAKLQSGSVSYLMGLKGNVVAASNRAESASFVGKNFKSRPYFQAAVAGGQGLYLAMGQTTLEPGLFSSVPIRDVEGTIRGVLVLKITLSKLNLFGSVKNPAFLVQENGVVLSSNRPAYINSSFQSISETTRRELVESRQFPFISLKPIFPVEPSQGAGVRFENISHHYWKAPTGIPGWHLVFLSRGYSLALARAAVIGFTFLAALGIVSFFIAREKELRFHQDREAIRAQLYHSEKLASLGTLAAGVGHEINNPLAIVAGFAGMLRKRLAAAVEDKGARDDCLAILSKQETGIRRIEEIVLGLRNYARADSSLCEAMEIHEAIHETLSLITQILEGSGIKVVLELADSNPAVFGNKGRFQQVLMNLLTNARDAVEKRVGTKQITIKTSVIGDRVIMQVTDNGPGIPESVRDRIFDPYFTTKAPGKGTGLGLSICRSLLESFSARIDVSSIEGRGTTFSVNFPLTTATKASCREAVEAIAPLGNATSALKGRVLIVDDEAS